ncbi:MAG: substrate-binding domain-containing protein [bacterium]
MAQDLQHAIESGALSFGNRLRPLRELAAHYGVSLIRTQRVMVELERRGLVQRRHGAGVFVTYHRPEITATEAAVVMMVQHRDPLFDRFAGRLSDGLTTMGLQPIRAASLAKSEGALGAWLETWRHRPPRAVVVQQSRAGLHDAVERACGGRSLLAEVFRVPYPATRFHRLNPDYADACRSAVAYSLARGHRRIGLVTPARRIDPQTGHCRSKRASGHTYLIREMGRALCEAGVRRHGLAVHYMLRADALEQKVPSIDQNSALHPANMTRLQRWLQRPDRPTAVFGDDHRIAGVIRAATQLGLRIGEDLDVLGQGNTDWSQALNFPSIDLQPELVADEMLDLIRRNEEVGSLRSRHDVAVPVRLVER